MAEASRYSRDQQGTTVRIVQLKAPSSEALDILNEYYDAVHVVQRDRPEDIQNIIDACASGFWLACVGDRPVGCVVLRKLQSIPLAGECKRLYVRPSARGNGIAGMLLDVLEQYARSEGLKWIYLDSYEGLKTAIALYEWRGYQRCERYNDNPQATVFMRKAC